MITRSHRFTLAILLAVALFCITAHYATPAACCTPLRGGGCGCQSGAPERATATPPCLACMLETGIRYQQALQPVLHASIFENPIESSIEKPVEPTFGVFRPPISQL